MGSRIARIAVAAAGVVGITAGGIGTAGAAEPRCWGDATALFAQLDTWDQGEHASEQPTPRVGLPNLARALYDDGVIAEPTMAALGSFVATLEGVSIDSCHT